MRAIVAVTLTLLATIGFSASASGGATASRTVTVSMKNFFFAPKNVNISKGDRVVWSNTSTRKHTATKGGSFNTGKVKPGTAVAVKFNGAGTYRYVCSLHPEMTGKVIVGG
jgi:plastocyanin